MLLFLLTDFGSADTYVAQMKCEVLGRCGGGVQLVDLTHHVPRGSVREAAWHLRVSEKWIPPGSVVLAVVDPGVGSARRAVTVTSGRSYYVGPDNGVFSWLPPERAWLLPEPPGMSRTFHGRDVFALAAASLLCDESWPGTLEEIPSGSLVRLDEGSCARSRWGLSTSVAHVDSFGNAVLWMKREDAAGFLPASAVSAGGTRVPVRKADTYSDGFAGELLLLEGSQGYMELAVTGGSAADLLSLSAGDGFTIEGSSR
jgi:S-adenosylmethionine hydrolase